MIFKVDDIFNKYFSRSRKWSFKDFKYFFSFLKVTLKMSKWIVARSFINFYTNETDFKSKLAMKKYFSIERLYFQEVNALKIRAVLKPVMQIVLNITEWKMESLRMLRKILSELNRYDFWMLRDIIASSNELNEILPLMKIFLIIEEICRAAKRESIPNFHWLKHKSSLY